MKLLGKNYMFGWVEIIKYDKETDAVLFVFKDRDSKIRQAISKMINFSNIALRSDGFAL